MARGALGPLILFKQSRRELNPGEKGGKQVWDSWDFFFGRLKIRREKGKGGQLESAAGGLGLLGCGELPKGKRGRRSGTIRLWRAMSTLEIAWIPIEKLFGVDGDFLNWGLFDEHQNSEGSLAVSPKRA